MIDRWSEITRTKPPAATVSPSPPPPLVTDIGRKTCFHPNYYYFFRILRCPSSRLSKFVYRKRKQYNLSASDETQYTCMAPHGDLQNVI